MCVGGLWADTRDDLWDQVDQARQQGLPQTAIGVLEEIIPSAIADEAYAEAVKAVAYQAIFTAQIQGGLREEKVMALQTAMETAPAPMQPMLQGILAHWLWDYLQAYSYIILERTETSQVPSEDFRTWDLSVFLEEIDGLFEQAWTAEDDLKATPIADYAILLEEGTVSDATRPTLYDFLVHDALDFYSAAEQAASQPQDLFVIMADSPIFAPLDEFLPWEPDTPYTDSALVKSIALYQSLYDFHSEDADVTAFLDVELCRLDFGANQAVGPDKQDLYAQALERFVNSWPGHDAVAEALYEWASILDEQGDAAGAHSLALQGYEQYPATYGGKRCYNLLHQIEARSAELHCERVWNDPWPDIEVTYRNVTHLYLRLVAYDPLASGLFYWNALSEQTRDAILADSPDVAWDQALPATDDYLERTERIGVPTDLEPGFYFLIGSFNPSFQEDDNQISVRPIWVSDLSMVVRRIYREGVLEGLVCDAQSGEPLDGVTVTRWFYQSSLRAYQPGAQARTDSNGLFSFNGGVSTQSSLLVAQKNGQVLATQQTYATSYAQSDPSPVQKAVFFTDRALYRPGQTIHYKGICLQLDTVTDRYQTLAGRSLSVIFRDVTGQEIARQSHQSNDYGSFSGSFTAPDDRLLGTMSLSIANAGFSGSTTVQVEEYSRPQFRVELEVPEEAPCLDEQVSIPGLATAYTGAAINDALVQWRVERQIGFPRWCWWAARVYSSLDAQTVATGTCTTGSDGRFTIAFDAAPDLAVSPDAEPIFTFSVTADVTDTTGETRSQQLDVQVGYTALAADVTAADWLTVDDPVVLTVTTTALDGTPEQASGQLQVWRLEQPDRAARPLWTSDADGVVDDPADPETWAEVELVYETAFATESTGRTELGVNLAAGIYRVMIQTEDRFGTPVTAHQTLTVMDPQADAFSVRVAHFVAAPAWTAEPGDVFTALWGTGYEQGRAFVEWECRGELLQAGWTGAHVTQELWECPVTEDMRGGFTLRVTYVRENRAYVTERIVDVPWTSQELSIAWETFRSELWPGQEEQWTAVITGPDAVGAVAEMVACLYDAALDQILPHSWLEAFTGYRQESARVRSYFQNDWVTLQTVARDWNVPHQSASKTYWHWPNFIVYEAFTPLYDDYWNDGTGVETGGGRGKDEEDANDVQEALLPEIDLDQVSVRTDLDETAFFYPHLQSDRDGEVRIEFTVPEALTTWQFMGFAHDTQMRSASLFDQTVTAKDLMVQPYAPRFVREGDVIEFTVKVSNQSAARQTGQVRLSLLDAWSLDSRDEAVGNVTPEQSFDIPSMESRSLSWRLTLPDGCDMLVYRAVGATTRLSDGQEGYLPVLSRRMLVTESLPLPIRNAQTKQFEFAKLLESGASSTLQHQSLTVQMVSQPAWYAILALPYLMETTHEYNTQRFNRLYANSLAAYVANSDPEIRRIFNLWKNTDVLESPLEQNEDLKDIALEETPWLRQAVSEGQARQRVGILFDENRLTQEISRIQYQLEQAQYSSGLWPWCPGGRGSEWVTLSIVTGMGRLRHLGVNSLDHSTALKALDALDDWMDECYRDILKYSNPDDNHLSATMVYYLYGRSFYLSDQRVSASNQTAFNYWQDQAATYWLSLERQSQGQAALALKRLGDLDTAGAIMASIREHAVYDDELGMYWRDTERSWWWYRAPIETQAVMIEAFDEVEADANAVEDCRVWLLKQKQTQDWETTRATADAVYALLLRGVDWLGSHELVEVALDGQWIEPDYVEPGTGYYEQRWVRSEIEPEMGYITVSKVDEGVSWGSVHWQYLEDMSKITPYEGTPLQLSKELYVKQDSASGEILVPVTDGLSVGDELVTRITLQVDRDMEYLHMKDQRGSGTEPLEALSGYRYQGGLGYYQSVRDTATHFFMDVLPKGIYVFEYSTRVQHKGVYQSGITSIQCLYAPEFNSHSESVTLTVE